MNATVEKTIKYETCGAPGECNIPGTKIPVRFACMALVGHEGDHTANGTMNGHGFGVAWPATKLERLEEGKGPREIVVQIFDPLEMSKGLALRVAYTIEQLAASKFPKEHMDNVLTGALTKVKNDFLTQMFPQKS